MGKLTQNEQTQKKTARKLAWTVHNERVKSSETLPAQRMLKWLMEKQGSVLEVLKYAKK